MKKVSEKGEKSRGKGGEGRLPSLSMDANTAQITVTKARCVTGVCGSYDRGEAGRGTVGRDIKPRRGSGPCFLLIVAADQRPQG